MKEVEIIIDGEKYPCQISDEAVVKIKNVPKETGYERGYDDKIRYWSHNSINGDEVIRYSDTHDEIDNFLYCSGNYYNSKELAINIVRADRLLQRLRQWQALNDAPVDWSNTNAEKFYIRHDRLNEELISDYTYVHRDLFNIYFTSDEKANEAIEIFRGDLMWYFTEYKQRLDEK